MKKATLFRLGALALIVCIAMALLLSGTLARYTSTVTGTGTANIAQWAIAFKQDDAAKAADYDFNLKDTKEANALVNADTIAPGDKGSFTVKIDGTGSEVAYRYSIELVDDNFTETAGNVKFYSDESCTTPWADIENTDVALAAVGTPIEKTIYWEWEGGEDNNANDTTAGLASADLTFTVKLTAEQSIVTP